MKKTSPTANARTIMAVTASIAGIVLAVFIYQYTIIVRGIIGIVTLAFSVYYSINIGVDGSFGELLNSPKFYKSFAYTFLVAGINYWTIQDIYKMIKYILTAVL